MNKKEYWYWLCQNECLGVKSIGKLMERFGTPEEIFNIEEREIAETNILNRRAFNAFIQSRVQIEKILKKYHKEEDKGIQFITIEDDVYPKRLKYIFDPPFGLFVKGRLPEEGMPVAAIIGARNCSFYGQETAGWLSRELSKAGVRIVSGMASGIDASGQWGAVNCGMASYAVLGCGPDIVYPRENYFLYERLLENGGIISEYPSGTKPLPFHFPMRNRIISGLADCVVVVEARKKSGSLITADLALEQGKEVAAVPGRIGDELSEGCNELIQIGAHIVLKPEDILEILKISPEKYRKSEPEKKIVLDQTKKKVYSCLDLEPKYLEKIVLETGLERKSVMESLLVLELNGYIRQTAKNYYGLKLKE